MQPVAEQVSAWTQARSLFNLRPHVIREEWTPGVGPMRGRRVRPTAETVRSWLSKNDRPPRGDALNELIRIHDLDNKARRVIVEAWSKAYPTLASDVHGLLFAAEVRPVAASGVLRHIHDVRAVLDDGDSDREVNVRLAGVVTKRRKSTSAVYFDLVDPTGSIQLLAEQIRIPQEAWLSIAGLRKGNRVVAMGTARWDGRQHTVDVTDLEVRVSREFIPDERLTPDLYSSALSTRYLLARLRGRATEAFSERDYEEYEPNYISTKRDRPGLEPLEVRFPGWGVNAMLVPSPAPQLLEAIIVGGSPKVFSIARSFWTGVRDGFTSAEKLILVARHLGGDIETLENLAEDTVRAVLSHFTTMPLVREGDWLDGERWPRRRAHVLEAPRLVPSPEFRRGVVKSGGEDVQAFRLFWPAHKGASRWSPPVLTLAEGHLEMLGGALPLGCLTLNLERMTVLLSEAPLSRMRDLVSGLGPEVANAG